MGIIMNTYCVTGAAGFIGYHVCKKLLDRGEAVLAIDNLNNYYDPELKFERLDQLGINKEAIQYNKVISSSTHPYLQFIRVDIEDYDNIFTIFKDHDFSCVIHLAAQAGVRYSIDHPFSYTQSNITGFLSILEACRHNHIPHLVYASSSSVYGLNTQQPFSIHHGVDHPISLYAATKRANELMAHTYSHLCGLPTTGLRFFTVYGPWGRPDMAYFKFATAILEGKPIDVYNFGNMYRDFTFIDDIVEGILRVTEKPPQSVKQHQIDISDPALSPAPFALYNLGNSKPESLADFISILEQKLGKSAHKRFLPMQAGDVFATAADIKELEQNFGWHPHTTLQDGLEQFCNWFVEYYNRLHP